MRVAWRGLFLILGACTPVPNTPVTASAPVTPDTLLTPDPDRVQAEQVCAKFVAWHCAVGCDGGVCTNAHGTTCVETLLRAADLVDLDLPCVLGLTSPSELTQCGDVWTHACL